MRIINIFFRILLILIALLFIVIGIIGIRDHLWHLLVIGSMILLVTILWNAFKNRTNKTLVAPKWKKIRSMIVGILIVITMIDLGLIIAGIVVAQSDFSGEEDGTVVILGTDVKGDQPSDLLKQRLDTAITYLKEHSETNVIVSGKGRGQYTEAEVMYQYLINGGINANRIYQEDQAQSTPENLVFSKDIIQQKNLPKQMIIVTNNYHQLRASIYAKQHGISVKNLSAPTTWYMLFPLSERERYIIITEWLGLSPDLVNKYKEI